MPPARESKHADLWLKPELIHISLTSSPNRPATGELVKSGVLWVATRLTVNPPTHEGRDHGHHNAAKSNKIGSASGGGVQARAQSPSG